MAEHSLDIWVYFDTGAHDYKHSALNRHSARYFMYKYFSMLFVCVQSYCLTRVFDFVSAQCAAHMCIVHSA